MYWQHVPEQECTRLVPPPQGRNSGRQYKEPMHPLIKNKPFGPQTNAQLCFWTFCAEKTPFHEIVAVLTQPADCIHPQPQTHKLRVKLLVLRHTVSGSHINLQHSLASVGEEPPLRKKSLVRK